MKERRKNGKERKNNGTKKEKENMNISFVLKTVLTKQKARISTSAIKPRNPATVRVLHGNPENFQGLLLS